jgi:hypothetical protein
VNFDALVYLCDVASQNTLLFTTNVFTLSDVESIDSCLLNEKKIKNTTECN